MNKTAATVQTCLRRLQNPAISGAAKDPAAATVKGENDKENCSMQVTQKRTIDFSGSQTRRAATTNNLSESFANDSLDLSSSRSHVKSDFSGDQCYTGANTNIKSGFDEACSGASTDVKSGFDEACSGASTDVKSNLDDGLLFWCTGSSTDVKSDFSGDQCYTGANTNVKSSLDDGLFFWCTGASTDVKSASSKVGF